MVQYRLHEPSVVAEVVDGEVIAINLENGCYHSMRDGGARVWEALVKGNSIDAILQGSTQDAIPSRQALTAFVDELCRLELLLPATEGAITTNDAPVGTWDPAELRIETFRDMQDLLLLDPVHDVAVEAGWPVRR